MDAWSFFAVLVVVLVVFLLYTNLRQKGNGEHATDKIHDGGLLTFGCRMGPVIEKATYGPVSTSSSCATVDVSGFMQKWVEAHPGHFFVVSPASFPGLPITPCSDVRMLAVTYSCRRV